MAGGVAGTAGAGAGASIVLGLRPLTTLADLLAILSTEGRGPGGGGGGDARAGTKSPAPSSYVSGGVEAATAVAPAPAPGAAAAGTTSATFVPLMKELRLTGGGMVIDWRFWPLSEPRG